MLELLYTEDASETELTVKSGSVDVGLGIDVMRVLRAYAKGDPLIGANTGPAVSVLDSLDRRSRPILVSTERNRSMSHALKLATLIPRTEAPGSKGQVRPVVGSTTYDITVADLANVACLSIFHFTRTFAATMGVPPHRYVSRRRLESAKTMIATGRASLSEIAFNCQFSSQSSFTRAFRRAAGMMAAEYRRTLNGGKRSNEKPSSKDAACISRQSQPEPSNQMGQTFS